MRMSVFIIERRGRSKVCVICRIVHCNLVIEHSFLSSTRRFEDIIRREQLITSHQLVNLTRGDLGIDPTFVSTFYVTSIAKREQRIVRGEKE